MWWHGSRVTYAVQPLISAGFRSRASASAWTSACPVPVCWWNLQHTQPAMYTKTNVSATSTAALATVPYLISMLLCTHSHVDTGGSACAVAAHFGCCNYSAIKPRNKLAMDVCQDVRSLQTHPAPITAPFLTRTQPTHGFGGALMRPEWHHGRCTCARRIKL